MNYKFKLSDIVRYITVGFVVLFIALFAESQNLFYDEDFFLSYKDKIFAVEWIGPILILFLSYFCGVFIYAIFRELYGSAFLGLSISDECYFIKRTSHWLVWDDIPSWIYWSSHPDIIARELREDTEIRLQSETRSEFYLFNQFAQVLYSLCNIAVGLTIIKHLFHEGYFLTFGIVIAFLLIQILFSRIKIFIKNAIFPIVTNLGSLCVWLCIVNFYIDDNDVSLILNCFIVCCTLCFFVARFFAKEHIKSLNSICISNEDKLIELLKSDDIPTAYILIRTNSDEYLKETLDSINIQTYPCIKVLILEDKTTDETTSGTKIRDKIDEIIYTFQNDNQCKFDILRYFSNESGPYKLSLEIRKIFLTNAEDKDVAIILDSDDLFRDKNVVTNIVTQMYKTKSNICLMGFVVFGSLYLNNSKNYHNRFIKLIARKLKGIELNIDSKIKENIYHVETLGWTKCYKKSILQNYQDCLDLILRDQAKEYNELTRFEDFPDIVCLLQKGARITALNQPCYNYRKHKISVTSSATVEIYIQQVIPFLMLSYKLLDIKKNDTEFHIDDANSIIKKFILFKFIQYLDTSIRRFNKENATALWDAFKDQYKNVINDNANLADLVEKEIEAIIENNIFDINDTKDMIREIINE